MNKTLVIIKKVIAPRIGTYISILEDADLRILRLEQQHDLKKLEKHYSRYPDCTIGHSIAAQDPLITLMVQSKLYPADTVKIVQTLLRKQIWSGQYRLASGDNFQGPMYTPLTLEDVYRESEIWFPGSMQP